MPWTDVPAHARLALRPVELRAGKTLPFGPARSERDWMTRGACTAPDVDPAWWVAEETDVAAIQQAKRVCRTCPVRLDCRLYAEETNEFGVYAGQTYSERTARLHYRWREAI
jgi:WhiB family redox-sensing transcriptional regulator